MATGLKGNEGPSEPFRFLDRFLREFGRLFVTLGKGMEFGDEIPVGIPGLDPDRVLELECDFLF